MSWLQRQALLVFWTLFTAVLAQVDITSLLSILELSPTAQVHYRNTPGYNALTQRWQYWNVPDVSAVVEIATASDVAATIRFANAHDIPFTAQSGGHGGFSTLGEIKNGIQINLRRLNHVKISEDGNSATIGGGLKSKELLHQLWKEDKWSLQGCCECTGVTAVALGGGHGILQGRYGLLSDQIISLNMTLANGTEITVSETQHKELFWGMRGAGHNFGIVTGIEWRIYDIPEQLVGGKVWSVEVLIYEATKENVEEVYKLAKKMVDEETHPEGLLIYGVVVVDPASGKVVLIMHFVFNGPLSSMGVTTSPFHLLRPLSATAEEGTFLDVPRYLMTDDASISCNATGILDKPALIRFPVDVKTYDIPALTEAIEKFSEFVTSNKEFAGSMFLIEQYATQAVHEKRGNDAVPWREQNLLLAPVLLYSTTLPSASNLSALALKKGTQLRSILTRASQASGGFYSYVNYAYGGESLAEMYGVQNLERLRVLKRTYDPEERLRWFAGIGVGDGAEGKEREKDEL